LEDKELGTICIFFSFYRGGGNLMMDKSDERSTRRACIGWCGIIVFTISFPSDNTINAIKFFLFFPTGFHVRNRLQPDYDDIEEEENRLAGTMKQFTSSRGKDKVKDNNNKKYGKYPLLPPPPPPRPP